uniref:Cell division protein FtsL n=1 Tax=Desulfatirhabdium butyrativorans TaxID=340467 RepID=A0A7C4RPR6_9BACT
MKNGHQPDAPTSPSKGWFRRLWESIRNSGSSENGLSHRRRSPGIVEPLSINRVTVLALFAMAALFEALVLVSLDIRQKNVQKEILQEIQRNQNLQILENNLDIELAGLESPERIAEIARNHLGLAMPNHQQIQVLP